MEKFVGVECYLCNILPLSKDIELKALLCVILDMIFHFQIFSLDLLYIVYLKISKK